jgi:WD40 repeat protein
MKAVQAWTLVWDEDWVTAASFLGPTRLLAAGNNVGEILIWVLPERGKPAPLPTLRLQGHANCISRLRSSKDGRWLYSSGYDKALRVWDLKSAPGEKQQVELNRRAREEIKRRPGSGRKMPDPLTAEVRPLKPARTLEGHGDWVTAFDLSADGKTLVSGDDTGRVIVWDTESGKEVRRWQVKGWVYSISLSPDASRVVVTERVPLVFDSGRLDGAKVWDVKSGKLLSDLGPAFKGMYLAGSAWSADGKAVYLGRGGECDGPNGLVHVASPESGKKTATFTGTGHLNGMTDLAWHPGGKHLISTGRDTMFRIWDVEARKLALEVGKGRGGQFKDWLHCVAVSTDGKWLAAGDMAGAVQVWELSGGG